MIIDCHGHIWPSRDKLGGAGNFSCLARPEITQARPEEHLAECQPAEMMLVLGFVSSVLNAEIPNDYIFEYVSSQPDRLLGFAGVDPSQVDCREKLRQYKNQRGFSGITVSPACQGYHPCDSRAMRVYELAEEMALPVYFLHGEKLPAAAVLNYAQPMLLDEVVQSFPNLKIVISHLGSPWMEQTFALLAKHENVYADMAGLVNKPWQAYRSLRLAYEFGVIEKILFASDYPNHTVKEAVETLYNLNKISLDSVLPAVPREHLRGIVERDSLSLLGLHLKKPAPDPSTVS
ncbi:MAG: Amidohydrolase [Planctomycetes bacterium ADurb.Bin412]|jgi:predicted TIM-barrel fold metal-dependent hydrolase|nr:MAG: Amidohydrolase [Planctomycetes bacterium ADurb.Bin412]